MERAERYSEITGDQRGDALGSVHQLQLYDLDAAMLQSVRELGSEALRRGDAVVVITTPLHRRALTELLAIDGVDVARVQADGRYISLDAAEVLAQITEGGSPDAARFDDVVGGVVGEAASRHGKVVAFGEMVNLLVIDGNPGAAIELEVLWNSLLERHPGVTLLCGYAAADVDALASPEFKAGMLEVHTGSVPEGRTATGRPLEPLEMTHILVRSAPRQAQPLDFFIDVGAKFDLAPDEVRSSLETLRVTGHAWVTDQGYWRAGRLN